MSSKSNHNKTCLLIIDMINEFAFDGAEDLLPNIEQAAERIAALKQRAKDAGVPVLYVNDNFGKWRSDFQTLAATGNNCALYTAADALACRTRRISFVEQFRREES